MGQSLSTNTKNNNNDALSTINWDKLRTEDMSINVYPQMDNTQTRDNIIKLSKMVGQDPVSDEDSETFLNMIFSHKAQPQSGGDDILSDTSVFLHSEVYDRMQGGGKVTSTSSDAVRQSPPESDQESSYSINDSLSYESSSAHTAHLTSENSESVEMDGDNYMSSSVHTDDINMITFSE